MKFLEKGDNCYAVMITETTEGVPIEVMEYFVLEGARELSPDAEITTREYGWITESKCSLWE